MNWRQLLGLGISLLIVAVTSAESDDDEKRVVCYYTNWSVYRPGTAKFSPQNINPYLCTHLIYAFGGFTKDNTLKPFDKYQDIDKGGYAKFTGLKSYNKNLKTLLAVGGWNEGSGRFSPMVADPERRRKFVKNSVKFLRQNHFDGLDLDWEYPAHRDGGKPRDKENYANLVQELREEYEKESSKTGRPRLLLTMAVPAGIEYIDKGYDIPRLNKYLDFINLLSYDYHSAYEPAVNHHAPLYPLEEDNEYNYDNELTIDYTIKHLLKSGASAEKIVVGIPTYGRSYTLFNEDATALGSPADGPGAEGDATREKGYLAYYEICEGIEKDDWIVEKPNPKAMGPFAYKEKQWVGYDDEDIVRAKSKYVNENNLGGIMFWSIDNDDFRGKCHGRPYPLIEAAKEALLGIDEEQKQDKKSNKISTRERDTSRSSSSNKKTNNSSRRNLPSRTSSNKRLSSSSNSKSRSRTKSTTEETQSEDEIDNDAVRSRTIEVTETPRKSASRTQTPTNKSRFRSRLNTNERDSRKKPSSVSTAARKSAGNKNTTPEPPTTPDPGSDFKCEDEGFFPHPRDCKKYFWCLDSGPSGLGIVANQFTCPSGLVFNKLADSCDYPRNVVCPKPKAATTTTTTERTTTEEEKELIEEDEDDEEYVDEDEQEPEEKVKELPQREKPRKVTTTTVRSLLYKTITRNRPKTTTTTSTTTTTTTAAPPTTADSARSSDDIPDEEQDPRVIKELIDLIKKAGGIEQLEKQLSYQEKNSDDNNQKTERATPPPISKSLYQRVLSRQSAKNFLGIPSTRLSNVRKAEEVKKTENKEDDVEVEDDEEVDDEEDDDVEEEVQTINNKSNSRAQFVNGPGRSQFEGLDQVPEVKGLRRSNKPKYVTIERHSSSTTSTKIDDDLLNEDDNEEEETDNDDNTDISPPRVVPKSEVIERKSTPAQRNTPGYVNIRRSRPTSTTESARIDEEYENSEIQHPSTRRTLVTTEENKEDIAEVPERITPSSRFDKDRYVVLNRFRTTAAPLIEEESTNSGSTLSTPTNIPSTVKNSDLEIVTDKKIITVAGESGRVRVTTLSPEPTSATHPITEEASSSVRSTSSLKEEKQTTPVQYTIEQTSITTPSYDPNIIEDNATDKISTVLPTELNTRVTIAAVSQPRPFGYPRRTRPTTSSISQTTPISTVEFASTQKTKVFNRRKPGLNLFRQPGVSTPSRGIYTTLSPATLASTKKIYPIENTRVLGITTDQSGNSQNLELILADPPASDNTGTATIRPNFRRKISTTSSPTTTKNNPPSTNFQVISPDRRRKGQKHSNSPKVAPQNSYRTNFQRLKPAIVDYDYYEDEEERFVGVQDGKIFINSRGFIKCLDQGSFAHPSSCKKFISCAKMVNGVVVGTEYTCPNKLSFDPIGGICNWSAGLGCNE